MAVEKASSIPLGLVIVVLLVAAWILHKLAAPKEVHGDVSLGDPTVTGEAVIPGSDVYWSRRTDSIELDDPSNPGLADDVRELIWRSNRAIAADDAEEGE